MQAKERWGRGDHSSSSLLCSETTHLRVVVVLSFEHFVWSVKEKTLGKCCLFVKSRPETNLSQLNPAKILHINTPYSMV